MAEAQIYNSYVESCKDLSERRWQITTFFVTLNTAIIGLKDTNFINPVILMLFGILMDMLWIKLLTSYRRLNSAKWRVIQKFEEKYKFPVQLYTAEQDEYDRLKTQNRTQSISRIELLIPVVVIICFLIMMARIYIKTLLG
ncbi:MAG: hypothetical protein LBL75_04000 [Rickettsiales bacterium]|nr:hypothetical protein [Rickettsiales bacterium]